MYTSVIRESRAAGGRWYTEKLPSVEFCAPMKCFEIAV